MTALGVVGGLAIALVAASAGFALASIAALARLLSRASPPTAPALPVTLLKPLHGDEPGLLDRLSACCTQHYAGPVELVCGVARADDPAVAVVAALRLRHPEVPIALVIDATRHGSNAKVSNLINMMAAASHDILVLSDSDIAVRGDWLRTVVDALAAPNTGVVTCLYAGVPGGNVWSRLAAMQVSHQFLPQVAVARWQHLADPCMGSTIALTRDTLAAIGGFRSVADILADDNAIGVAVRNLGKTIALPPLVVGHCGDEPSFATLWRHELRWARTVRGVDPLGYAGSLVTHLLPLAGVAAALLPAGLGLYLLVAAVVIRVVQVAAIDRLTGWPAARLWLLLPRDGLSFLVFIASFFIRTVAWRGVRLRLGANGVMRD